MVLAFIIPMSHSCTVESYSVMHCVFVFQTRKVATVALEK